MSHSSSSVISESSTLEYEQESFETFRVKVVQLCIEVGLGAPAEVERMAGGSFNRVIGVKFSSPSLSRYIIRIPRMTLDETEAHSIKDQVAVLLFLSAHLPVAKVAAYDCTTLNAIKSQFMIQERLPGQSIEAVYDDLTLEERLQVSSGVADLVRRIDSVILPRFGRLVERIPMSDVSHQVLQCACDGKIDVTAFRLDPSTDMPTTNADNLLSLLRELCEVRSEEDGEDEELQGYWQKIQQMITEMEHSNIISKRREKPRLWHWDLSKQNILVDKVAGVWSVTGILDWDDAMSIPGVIGRKPPIWLWRPEVRVEDADTTESGLLTDDQNLIKDRFDEVITASIPSFVDDAYGSGKWIRRVATFALYGFEYSQDWTRYKVLIEDWDSYYRTINIA
jgi:aminoglycoside phosphotransferase (APT) family kinase protein